MSNAPVGPGAPRRHPNRGFRPPPETYTAAQANLPDGRPMSDYLCACLVLLAREPDTAVGVLAAHWARSRAGSRGPGTDGAGPRAPRRHPNRGFRPPPETYTAAQANLPDGRPMSDYLCACLDLLGADPDTAGDVLAGHWPPRRRGGRPRGARDTRPRALRGGGRWWAAWDDGEVYAILPGRPGLTGDQAAAQAAATLRVQRAFRVEPCDDRRAAQLRDWPAKSEAERAALRPAWARAARCVAD